MPLDRLVIANFGTGFETDRLPFIINNDAFPVLENAYVWRGRVLRKRGTSTLGILQVEEEEAALGSTDGSGNFSGNIFTILSLLVLYPDMSLTPGSITVMVGAQNFTEPTPPNGTLTNGAGGTGTINYTTGALTINTNPNLAATPVTITFSYYPHLPVMGFEDFEIGTTNQPIPIAFDTRFSYGFDQGLNEFYNTTFYKGSGVPFNFAGANYQQFWSINYQGVTTITDTTNNSGCLWVTNGNPGFHFLNATYVSGTGTTTITFNFKTGGVNFTTLRVGDVLWFNEWASGTLNGVSGTVSNIAGAASGNYVVTFMANQTVSGTGISQMMTNFLPNQDGIRWYDGDPTVSNNFGWVNFAPPLSAYSVSNPTNLTPQYLVGAKVIVAFKNRLLFFGVYLSTSSSSPGIQYFSNRMVYSQVGTPFYSQPMPFPLRQTLPQVQAWYQSTAGRGGFLTSPVDQIIVTVEPARDLLICEHESSCLKLIYSGDDTLPFYYQTINSELGAQSTFSAIKLHETSVSLGEYGFALATTENKERIDLIIPDEVFQVSILNHDLERVTAIRDYQKEFIYFTFCASNNFGSFNTRTLLYNYRDITWAQFNETYTHYGTLRRNTDRTWSNIGEIYETWSEWNVPWSFGGDNAFFPVICGGNQQGYVMEKGDSTGEGNSAFIQSISGNSITSPDHCLQTGDYIQINNMIGSTNLNGTIQQVGRTNDDVFTINDVAIGTYLGLGEYTRVYVPFIQTKQFPTFWKDGRGVRIGTQRFLLDKTPNGEITVNLYSSQDSDTPDNGAVEDGYNPFTNVVLTRPEDPIYYPSQTRQEQIWHRMSQSFNGDSVQLSFTLSNEQLKNLQPSGTVFAITAATNASACVLATSANFQVGTRVLINGVIGMNQLNENQYIITASNSTTATLNVDSSTFGAYVSGGTVVSIEPLIQFSEIALHAIVLDLYPGPTLAY